jgi:hypothetical protein
MADETITRLANFFHRNGYVRWQNPERLRDEGYMAYKKGDEIRIVCNSLREIAEVRSLLVAAGFAFGRHFRRARQYRLPIYGREQVARFLKLVGSRRRTRTTPDEGR